MPVNEAKKKLVLKAVPAIIAVGWAVAILAAPGQRYSADCEAQLVTMDLGVAFGCLAVGVIVGAIAFVRLWRRRLEWAVGIAAVTIAIGGAAGYVMGVEVHRTKWREANCHGDQPPIGTQVRF